MSDKQWIFLLITILVIYQLVKGQEENSRSNYRPPTPPSYQPSWNRLHPDFNNSEYVKQWEQAGYDARSAWKWVVDCQVEPNELELVNWIKTVKGLSPDDITSRWGSSGVNPLRGE